MKIVIFGADVADLLLKEAFSEQHIHKKLMQMY